MRANDAGVVVHTSTRRLLLDLGSKLRLYQFLKAVHDATSLSEYLSVNRFGSFCPIRERNHVDIFHCGRDYFEQLAEDLAAAREEVMIRGWWVCPELYLRRPVELHQASRLDRVLLAAASR